MILRSSFLKSFLVWINGFGKTDFKGILQSVSKKDYLRYICYLAETSIDEMRKESRKSGQNISYQTFIIDMENLSMRQMSYKPSIPLTNFILIQPNESYVFEWLN